MPSIIRGVELMLDYYKNLIVGCQRVPNENDYFEFRSCTYNIERWIYEDKQCYISCPIIKCLQLICNARDKLKDALEERSYSRKEYLDICRAAYAYNQTYDGFSDDY